MQTHVQELIDLENRFWQALVADDADAAVSMLDEPAFAISEYGAVRFDHAGYREMAEKGPMLVKSFKLSDMKVEFPKEDTAVLTYRVKQTIAARDGSSETEQEMVDSSVWTRKADGWRCVLHTETPFGKTMH